MRSSFCKDEKKNIAPHQNTKQFSHMMNYPYASRLLLISTFVLSTPSVLAEQHGDFTYSLENNRVTVTQYTGDGGDVVVPEVMATHPVKAIKAGAFHAGGKEFQNKLSSVTIPSSVSEIGDATFAMCTALSKVSIPAGVTRISNRMFWQCINLEHVVIPASVKQIGNQGFQFSGIKQVTIPAAVTEVGFNAFFGCKNLSSVIFLGDAPTRFGKGKSEFDGKEFDDYGNVFMGVAPGFTIRYFKGCKGFDSPEWKVYKLTEIDHEVESFDWYSQDGRALKGKFIKVDNKAVHIKANNGKEIVVPLAKLASESADMANRFQELTSKSLQKR
jgi:hypothetical protein